MSEGNKNNGRVRGRIHNPKHALRPISYERLRYDNGTPGNIDLHFDVRNRAHVIGELKHENNPTLNYGQATAYSRLVTDLNKVTDVLYFEARLKDEDYPDGANGRITNYRWKIGKEIHTWEDMPLRTTVKKLMDSYISKIAPELKTVK